MSQQDPTEVFLVEAEDLLATIEQCALDLANDLNDREGINLLFRAFHTIKGSGAMFGFDEVADFTHHVETILDEARSGTVELTPELIELLLAAKDQIRDLLTGEADRARGEDIVAKLQSRHSPAPQLVETVRNEIPDTAEAQEPVAYRIHFRPSRRIAATGQDPAPLLDELRALGDCKVELIDADLPALDELVADECYLAWNIDLVTDKGIDAIKDVFIFVEDDSEIRIEQTKVPAPAPVQNPSPASKPSTAQPEAAKRPQPKPVKPASAPAKASLSQGTVRVPSEKLDRLVGLVGELVMNQSRLSQVAGSIESSDLDAPVEEIERLVSELRDSVLGIRMMPIGSTFGRFRRLVHDLSNELGKEIELVTEGEDTELDKTVLDQLGDPLVHLIRNSLDHGIESPEQRLAAGKPRCGVVRLVASHEGAQVVVRIADDGRGLDPVRIRAKAIEKGLISPETSLSESEIFALIFQAGFSTAQTVTNVSGRGVGMDVVKRQIESLRGAIEIESAVGRGTTIALTLPLTLAIIDGQLVEIAGDRFILPMSAVKENVEITPGERAANNGRNLVSVRGELVPYIRLRNLFDMDDAGPEIEKVVIVTHDGQRVGFVVDRVLGNHQTVIQSLGRFYRDIDVVSGATIMGNGRVALILDVAGLVRADAARAADALACLR